MKKRLRTIIISTVAFIMLSLAFTLISFADTTGSSIIDAPLTDGRAFAEGEGLHISSDLTAMPKTYEAVVYVPEDEVEAGTIFGNYLNLTTPSFNFLINSSGKPYLHITDQNGNQLKKAFNYVIRGGESWVHVVITHTVTDTGSSFVCYVNGESVATATYTTKYELDMEAIQRVVTPYLGQDFRPTCNFKGRIKDVAIYSEPLTAEQVKASYNNGINKKIPSLMLCYDLSDAEGKSNIPDLSGNGYDVKPVFYERDKEIKDYDYSFAVVGDTQFLAYYDVYNGTGYYSDIYDWIVDNKDSKKIMRVFGLGDITENNGVDQTPDDGIDQTDDEWELAVANMKKLEDAGLPYSITWGPGHDTAAKFDQYFSGRDNFKNSDIHYYSGTSLENYYTKFTVGETKYMVMALRFTPDASVLQWASNAISQNKDHKVIIITHYYLELNAEIAAEAYPIWQNVIDKNSNVIMVLSGHVNYPGNIVRSVSVGSEGNKVNQFLINPQYMDKMYNYDSTGMVAMFYFSNGGKDVQVEYISAVQSLAGKDAEGNYTDVLYASKNQFDFAIEDVTVNDGGDTGYEAIPDEFADANEYPFILFDGNGNFIDAAKYFYGDKANDSAIALAKSELAVNVWDGDSYVGEEKTVVIVMRRNYVMASNETYNNISQVQGLITIDLSGFKLTAPESNYLFPTELKAWTSSGDASVYLSAITVKNGDVEIMDKSLIRFTPNANAPGKQFVYRFENVDFTVNGAAESFAVTHTAKSVIALYPEVHFVDCNIDISGASANNINLFDLGNENTNTSISVSGGSIKLKKSGYKIEEKASGEGSLVFYTYADDGYTDFILHEDADASSVNYAFNGDKLGLYETSANTYTLSEKTKYGVIPPQYADSTLYTILLFKNNVCVGAYNDFGGDNGAIMGAKTLIDGNPSSEIGSEVQMLLRNNAVSTNRYSNTGQSQGTIIIDLNEFTLTQTNTNHPLIYTEAKNYKGTADATINVINGSIVLKAELLYFGAYNSSGSYISAGGKYKTFFVNFDNVAFSYASGASATNFLGKFGDGITSGEKVGYEVTFNDCTFDFNNATKLSTVFNANDPDISKANAVVSVKVNGCEMMANSSNPTLYKTIEGSSVSFGKGSDGRYLLLKLSIGSKPSMTQVNAGELEFVQVQADGAYSSYRLMPSAVSAIAFTPKMNITLDRDLIVNVYIPAERLLKFTFDGKEYTDFASLEANATEIDGAKYYVVSVPLASSEAAREIKLIATVDLGETDANATYTFSTVRYAKKLIDGGSAETEVKLVKDILAYIKAAYEYFGKADSAEIAPIPEILGEGYNAENPPQLNGSAAAPSVGLTKATFVLRATPAVRFYIPSDASAASYEFFIDGVKLATEVGEDADGKYIEMDVYAYLMSGTITYTVDGEAGGSYHIRSYYEYSKTLGDAKLVTLVERFASYCESAKAYRDMVNASV